MFASSDSCPGYGDRRYVPTAGISPEVFFRLRSFVEAASANETAFDASVGSNVREYGDYEETRRSFVMPQSGERQIVIYMNVREGLTVDGTYFGISFHRENDRCSSLNWSVDMTSDRLEIVEWQGLQIISHCTP